MLSEALTHCAKYQGVLSENAFHSVLAKALCVLSEALACAE